MVLLLAAALLTACTGRSTGEQRTGAAGAVSGLVCALACHEQRVPPTINLDHPDPACDLDYVPRVARDVPFRVAMANGFAFGGENAVAVFRRYQG